MSDGAYTPQSDWLPDPFGRHELRRWDGVRWTERVRDGDLNGIDPARPAGLPAVAHLHPVSPITDAPLPLRYRSAYVPRLLAMALGVVGALFVLVIAVIALS